MRKHVPDKSRCEKMKELGIEFPDVQFNWTPCTWDKCPDNFHLTTERFRDSIPAPLVSEMAELLPFIDAWTVDWIEDTFDRSGEKFLPQLMREVMTSPNALADLLIYLKENNHLEETENG